MEAINSLIKDYENKLIDIDRNRESDNKAGDHSFYMEYDTSKENINEFIGELKKLQTLTPHSVSVLNGTLPRNLIKLTGQWLEDGDKHQGFDVEGRYSEIWVKQEDFDKNKSNFNTSQIMHTNK